MLLQGATAALVELLERDAAHTEKTLLVLVDPQAGQGMGWLRAEAETSFSKACPHDWQVYS
mgnify:CR=1 FL=1